MTLFKQIGLMLTIFLSIILTTVLTLNFQSANKGVQDRLYEDAKNTATSLSLSLGSANGDISMMSTMINANFDSGSYKEITLVDVEDEILYDRKMESDIVDVPYWFLNNINIVAPIAYANVSAGWSQVGILSVQSDAGFAYKQLYTILIDLLISFGAIAVVGFVILYLLLHVILKPLTEVQKQAAAVIRNKFIIQKNIPYTKEFKDVVLGMNNMVSKAKVMFEKGNEELRRQKELEYIDKATKLKNRKYLIDKLPEFLKIDSTSKGGVNMLVGLSGLIEANEIIGRQKVDSLFIDMAYVFNSSVSKYSSAIVARMNGTEFSIFIPDCSTEDGLQIAQKIYDSCQKIVTDLDLNTKVTFISLGVCEYSYRDHIGTLLARSDSALTQAKFNNEIYLEKIESSVEVMGKEEWRDVINSAITQNNFNFASYKAVDAKAGKVAHNALSLTLKVDKDTTYYYGQFMALANQLGLSNDIYDNVLEKLLKDVDKNLFTSACSLRLPFEYLVSEGAYKHMSRLFETYAEHLSFKLIIEMPDKLIRRNSEIVKAYKSLLEKYNIDMGVFEFIGESTDYYYLQDLRPVYIKAEASYFLTQSDQALSALRLITDTVGISLIAAGVMEKETLEELDKKDIHIIQGRATESIKLK